MYALTIIKLPIWVETLVTKVNELAKSSSGTAKVTFLRSKSGVSSVVINTGGFVGKTASLTL